MNRSSPTVSALVLTAAAAACAPGCRQALDLEVQYEPCLPITDSPYVEEFEGQDEQYLLDGCWQHDNLERRNADGGVNAAESSPAYFLFDHELVMQSGESEWSEIDQGPMLFRRLEGNFVVIARAEALDAEGSAGYCHPESKFAGIVLRKSKSEWGALLVSPHVLPGMDCEYDDPLVRAEVRSLGWNAATPPAADYRVEAIGHDAEADIAVCRINGNVSYYYHNRDADPPSSGWRREWIVNTAQAGDGGTNGAPASGRRVRPEHRVGTGPIDVGVTVGGGAGHFHVEGHFPRVVFQDRISEQSDACSGVLERWGLPSMDESGI